MMRCGRAGLAILLLLAAAVARADPPEFFAAAVGAYDRGDYAEARRLWEQALAGGDWEAARSLGTLYRRGLGVPADPSRAVACYRQAVEHGVVAAEPNLAEMLIAGQGVAADAAAGLVLLSHAAEHGILLARLRLEDIAEAASRDQPIPPLSEFTAWPAAVPPVQSCAESPPP
jgi:TPR repeat protein